MNRYLYGLIINLLPLSLYPFLGPAGAFHPTFYQQIPAAQAPEIMQMQNAMSLFYNSVAVTSGYVSPQQWDYFARSLVARHPHILFMTCQKQTSYGKLLFYYKNPNYLSNTGQDNYCYVYVYPTALASLAGAGIIAPAAIVATPATAGLNP